jgi:hypothetical protein
MANALLKRFLLVYFFALQLASCATRPDSQLLSPQFNTESKCITEEE